MLFIFAFGRIQYQVSILFQFEAEVAIFESLGLICSYYCTLSRIVERKKERKHFIL